MKAAASVKGWCPGAYRPMMSADGLVVRVRPVRARLTAEQALGLCSLSQDHGSGSLDLTNRANLQLRSVRPDAHEDVLQALAALDLLDADPKLESRRNILTTLFWTAGDLTDRLNGAVLASLVRLQPLPAKVGIAVDTGSVPMLATASADFRFERSAEGLILRADGAPAGRQITEAGAITALIEMADWFAAHRTDDLRRMAQVVATAPLPPDWTQTKPLPSNMPPEPGLHDMGALLGAPFGQIDAGALARTMHQSGATGLRLTPWRLFLLEGAQVPVASPFVTSPGDPLLNADACPGAPYCPSATVETRTLARALAPNIEGSLHVSGCAKGCARSRPATTTLVGRDGRFDLVEQGCAWDAPARTGVSPHDILDGA